MHLELFAIAASDEADWAFAVAKRVIEQVAERLLHAQPIDASDQPRLSDHLDIESSVGGALCEPCGDSEQHLVDIGGGESHGQIPPVGLGDRQEILRQAHETVGLHGCRGKRRCELARGAAAAESQVDLGLQDREGRAQLVARVSDEPSLVCEGLFEALVIAFKVVPRRAISSSLDGTGRRCPGREAETAAAMSRISSTGAKAAAATQYAVTDASSKATGPPISSSASRSDRDSSRAEVEVPTITIRRNPRARTGTVSRRGDS